MKRMLIFNSLIHITDAVKIIVIMIIETIDVLSKFHFYMRNNKKSYYIFAYAIFAKVKDMAIYI